MTRLQIKRTSCSAVANTTLVIALQWLLFQANNGQTWFAPKDIRHTEKYMLTLIHRLVALV